MIKPEIKVSIGPQKHGFLTILTMFRHIFESFTGIFTFFTFLLFYSWQDISRFLDQLDDQLRLRKMSLFEFTKNDIPVVRNFETTRSSSGAGDF